MDSSQAFLSALHKWMKVYTHRSISYFSVFAKEHGLSLSQLGALFQIQHKGCFSVSNLGEVLDITPAAASQMLDRLAHQGLIVRSEDPHDRRVKQASLTALERSTLAESFLIHKNWLNALATSLSSEEQLQIITAFDLLSEKTEHLADPQHDVESLS